MSWVFLIKKVVERLGRKALRHRLGQERALCNAPFVFRHLS
jgi:hypothetical protein